MESQNTEPPIKSRFVEWRAVEMGDPAGTQAADPRFINALRQEIANLRNGSSYSLCGMERADLRKWLQMIMDLANDPTVHFPLANTATLDFYQGQQQPGLVDAQIQCFHDGQSSILRRYVKIWQGQKTSDSDSREVSDKEAQRMVPQWYGKRCVLTGTIRPEAAYIVPVRAKDGDRDGFYKLLRMFWPNLPPAENCDFTIPGRESANILPLTQTAHALWDWHYFALRPIPLSVLDAQDGVRKLRMQVVWLRDFRGQRVESEWDQRAFGGIDDCRRMNDHFQSPAVRHGDVYELTTEDPIKFPLPSFDLLQLQFAVKRILSGMLAAGSLRVIFCEDPPAESDEDDGADSWYANTAEEWAPFLESAQELGILSPEKAALWEKAIHRQEKGIAERWAREMEEEEERAADRALFGRQQTQGSNE